VAG
jgi:hypothetical protein